MGTNTDGSVFGGCTPMDFGMKEFKLKIKIDEKIEELLIPANNESHAKELLYSWRKKGIPRENIKILSLTKL